MAITVVVKPERLTWDDFEVTADRIRDPGDGTLVDAFTRFDFELPDAPARKIGREFAMSDTIAITITPDAQVWADVKQTDELLSHEQLHYDVGIVTARALARQLGQLRAPTLAALQAQLDEASNLHFHRRAGLIQHRYDKDTNHGTIGHFQRIWKGAMAGCLAHPKADHLLGWWL